MAISNELSSEIAVALLSPANRSPQKLRELYEVILRVHSELDKMEALTAVKRFGPPTNSEQRSQL